MLLKGIDYDNLDNLCTFIAKFYQKNNINITKEEGYKLTQKDNLDEGDKQAIIEAASQCLKEGNPLGSKTINDGKINTSAWLSHCLYSSEISGNLAKNIGLNEDIAKTLGLLHDYGRKFDHDFSHTIKGFEELVDLGWYNEAISCLTHSFLNGGRCCNNEQAIEGFYVNDNGNPHFNDNTPKDDVTLFLENYRFGEYDVILNIADLMATDKGILPPHKRIADIATRRIIDPTNRAYFLAELTNTLIEFIRRTDFNIDEIKCIKANKNTALEDIQKYFKTTSEYFFTVYNHLSKEKKRILSYKTTKNIGIIISPIFFFYLILIL